MFAADVSKYVAPLASTAPSPVMEMSFSFQAWISPRPILDIVMPFFVGNKEHFRGSVGPTRTASFSRCSSMPLRRRISVIGYRPAGTTTLPPPFSASASTARWMASPVNSFTVWLRTAAPCVAAMYATTPIMIAVLATFIFQLPLSIALDHL